MGLFHPALQAKVSALDLNEDRDLISALEHLNQAGSKKQAVSCMKEALQKFKDHLDACQQLSQNHIEVLSELLFIPDSIHLHQLYISFMSALPAEVRLSVEKGLSARISPESESEYPQMLTAVHSLLKASVFSDMMRNIALDIMHVITAVLESIHECKGRRDIEQAQKSCTLAVTIGYTIVTTYRGTICQLKGSEECLQSCCHVAGAVMKRREFDNVEITLSLLIYSIMVVLESNQRDASIIVLLSILGEEGSSVLVQGTLQSAGGNDDKRSIMVSKSALYFQNFAADLSDRQSLLFLRTISQSLLDALSSCDHEALLAVFNDIFYKVSETYRVDPWSKIYYMDSIASVLKEVCRQMANAAGDDILFGGMPRGLEEHALRIVFDNLDDEEVIVIRSAQILLQDVLSVDKIRPSAHGGPGIMMKRALHFCSSLNSHQKSKYRILHSLEKYVTARQVLQENPKFIQDTIQAIAEDRAIKSLASSALAFVWRQLYFNNHRQCKSLNVGLSKEESVDALSRVLDAMVNADKSVQSAVTLYVLPGLIKNCPESFHVLLESFMNSSQKDETWLASCLSLLSFGKKEAVYENIKDLETENFPIFELLEEALLAESNAVHMPALELLITSAKTVDVPGRQELDLLWKYFNIMIRCTSKTSRQESIAIFVQFLRRIKVSVAAALTRPSDFSEEIHINVKFAEAWLRQLCRLCLSCLHPGGVYGKKYMGVEFLCVILEAFSVLITSDPRQPIRVKRNAPYMNMFQDKDAGQGLKYGPFKPFPDELYSFETTNMLLTALLEGWDRISNVSMSILLMLPSPIPGMESIDSVSQVLSWALKLLNSPRSVESDSGAKVLMTLFIKYVSESQWSIRLHPDLSCAIVRQNGIEKHSLEIEFVEDLISLSHMAFSQAEENLASASKNGIAHGYLLALRYICPHMAVNHVSQARELMSQVYQLLERGYQTIIPLLASPGEGLADADPEMLPGTHSKETDDEHFIRGAAWINSKEICHLVESMWLFCNRSDLMKACQGILEKMAELLLEILLQAKHYGTIDHARAALQFVCSKSNDWGSSELSESLLDHLFSQMLREEQSRRDAIRRSGGLPFAITAVLVPHAKSYLAMMAMKRLLNVLQIDTRYERGIYWPKVHALNALRLIYSESKLSALDTFYADGFRLILMSFSDPSWEIRNAASLCFASLVSKVMGFSNTEHRDHAEFWPKRSPTASQFFEKYESVGSFILEILERSNTSAESVQPCCESEQLLPPILALLCRLRPTIMDEQEHLSTKFQQYANLLKNCSASREMAIRKFASRAFVSVVPSSLWNVWSEQLSTSIANELSSQHVNWNQVHGHTLLLKEILRVYYSFTKQSEDISKAVCQKLGRSIRESIPIDSLEKLLCCPPVAAELLQVCILLARLNRLENFDMEMFEYYGGTVLNLLWPVFMDDRTWNDNVPSLSAIRKRLSELKFAWVFPVLCKIHDSKSACVTYMQETHRALQCPDYEVRDAALKCLLANFETIILPQINSHDELGRDLCSLYTTIRALWVHEPAFYPRIRMLQTLNMMHGYLWKSHGKHLILRDQLVDYYNADDGKNPALLQEIIVYSMHDALYHKTKGTAIFALGMILTYSHPQHPANLRQACLQSMNISGLMNPYAFCPPDPSSAPDIICHTSIDQYMEFWSSVLRLLEDEEPDIRMEASSSLQQYMFSKNEMSRSKYGAVRVEEIQERILQWLGGALSHYPSFTSHLQSWICIPEACRKHIHQVLAGKDDATIFKEETANQHTDPLILANLASKHLAQMATSSALSEEQQDAMHEWLGEIISALEDFIHSYMDLNGILYQELIPTIYEDVYRLFAALWTASHLAPTTIQGHMYKVCKLAHLSQNTEQQNIVSLTFTQPAISALMASALGHDNNSSNSTNDPHDSSFKISTRWQLV